MFMFIFYSLIGNIILFMSELEGEVWLDYWEKSYHIKNCSVGHNKGEVKKNMK
jgi:hypothetical protein